MKTSSENNESNYQREQDSASESPKQKVTHNLDTGKDEPLPDLDNESIMDFGSGSGGGSAGDGGAA
jgi:hypothetical protein